MGGNVSWYEYLLDSQWMIGVLEKAGMYPEESSLAGEGLILSWG